MRCPKCGRDTNVLETRWKPSGNNDSFNLRRRRCGSCGHRFNTYEVYFRPFQAAGEAFKRALSIVKPYIQ